MVSASGIFAFFPACSHYCKYFAGYASVCVRYALPDAYLHGAVNPWNIRDWKKDNGRYALYASVFRVTLFYPFYPYMARIPRIPAQAVPRNRRNHAEERGRKGMHHLMHTARIPGPGDAYPLGRSRPACRDRPFSWGRRTRRAKERTARLGRLRRDGPEDRGVEVGRPSGFPRHRGTKRAVFYQYWRKKSPVPEKNPVVCIGMRAVCIT